MKNSKILLPLLFVSLFIGNGCRKDELLLSHLSNYSRLNIMDTWNDTQRKFFNLGNSALRIRDLNSSHTHNRTSGFTIVDSTFTRFYNKLVSIDQQSDLSGKISNHVGFPIWQFVIIFDNQADHTATMYLPLGFETGSKTEAIITGIEFEENGVKKYSFKLTERAEIQEVLDNESKLSKYNNFAMEAIYFTYSDYFIFQDNYQPFVDRLIQMQENGLDLHTGQSTDILNINKKTKGTRSECRCELRVGEFLIDGEGNIIKEFKNNGLTPGGPGNGAGTGGGGNGGGNGDGNNHTQGGGGFEGLWHGTGIPPGGETFNDIYIVIFGWELIGWYNNNNNNFNEPEPESGAGGGELLFAYVRLKPKRPVIKGPDQTETRNGEETIIIQNFIDCGQDGFTADDLLVGDLKEGNTIMGMIESSDLDCATSKCMLANIPLFDKVEEFLSQSYIDPCTGEDVISEQDLNDAINAACSGDGRHAAMTFVSEMNEALEGNPHIKLSKNLATDCPKLNCILNKLLGEGEPSSDFLCNMLDQFDGNPTIGIRATVPKLGEPNFLGKTQVVNGKNILISFNKNNCNSTEVLDLFETFQHELVHADFYRQLFEDYGWTGDYLTLDETFRKLVEFKYGTNATPDQHILMLNELLPDMINSFMQANGSSIQCNGTEISGDCFYFKTLIINGFSEELLENELGISFDLHTNNLALYNLWKVSQPLYNTLNSCL